MRTKAKREVIVVGGGVAGLAAAGELGRRGFNVTLLEARARLGGRIFTAHPGGWSGPVELGAEFVHAGNAALWRRIRGHRLACRLVPPRHWLFRDGGIEPIDDVSRQIKQVTKRIAPRRMRHWSFADFMRACGTEFSDADRRVATGFVEGFQAATTSRMSAAAIADETLDECDQFRLPRGYDEFVAVLAGEMPPERVSVHCNAVVTRIDWRRHAAEVRVGRETFSAEAVVLTLPLGVWLARSPQRGAVTFRPALRRKQSVLRTIGRGKVIRIVLRVDGRRWAKLLPPVLRPSAKSGFGFIHSRVKGVPVWWAMSRAPVLTGWAGGPAAARLSHRSESAIRAEALRSLSEVFNVALPELRAAVTGWATHNWTEDPFSRGAYSFIAAGHEDAAEKLREPVQDTLFFAGEATADGEEIGTVHGALASGLRAAREVAARRR